MSRFIDDFIDLFEGRPDAVGGEQGRAIRCGPGEWREAIVHHVTRGPAVGVYPLYRRPIVKHGIHDEWTVHWGCVDFDIKSEGHNAFDYETEEEAHAAALNLQRVLEAFSIHSWVERTRSHGRHVWTFVDGWVEASAMRRCLLVACDVAGCSSREVNPKSDGAHLAPEQLGNYVRLPYPGNAAEGERAIFKEGGVGFFERKLFVQLARGNRSQPYVFQKVAALWRPPVQVVDFNAPVWDEDVEVPKVVRKVIEDGPIDNDRSRGLVYVAARCKEAGMTPDAALAVVAIADEAWGKYVGRSDREARLREVVERGWR